MEVIDHLARFSERDLTRLRRTNSGLYNSMILPTSVTQRIILSVQFVSAQACFPCQKLLGYLA